MDRVEHDLRDEQWGALQAAWGGCAYCGATDTPMQRDCVLALSRGGRYTLANIVPACRSCNASKCNDEVTGWLRRKRLDERSFLLRHLEIAEALAQRFAAEPDSRDVVAAAASVPGTWPEVSHVQSSGGMGAWGPGLYSDDLACDLRTTISAVCRLPKDGDEIIDLLCDLNGEVADDPDDGPVFWLVAADQLQRRGLESRARRRALHVIDEGTDLARLEGLGMDPRDVAKRRRTLEALRAKLVDPPVPKHRRRLATPQAHVVARGEVYAFPVDERGNPVNPYMREADRNAFEPAGWSSCLVARAGHALDYLAWCQLIVSGSIVAERPTLPAAVEILDADRHGLGTLSRAHLVRMRLELLGIASAWPDVPAPDQRTAIDITAADVSAANVLSQWRPPPGWGVR